MIKFAPILIALLYGVLMVRFSAWRTARSLDDNSTTLDDPHLNRLINKMANALDLPRIKVHVYEIEPINGLAAPDGRIFLTRGFIDRYEAGQVTPSELASVIAHELGHVALGHTRRRMIDFSGQNAVRTALAMVLNRFLPGVGLIIANSVMSLLMARLSRVDEYEADAYASALLVKSGIGTSAQKSLLERLPHITGAHGATTPAWLLSHPKPEERVKAIEKLENDWGIASN
ncbi:putative metalloprotease [Shimia isoporae]|uniref:Putative metalloprotease n=1 Tax=Shimia isoporae TaxID=647720 RepID=A0A4R1NPE6_9RHOB|nr:M48 family metallopeptidase [Shimia isoporae]TCL09719.1 putative metalloprotease [Shimia isoporae]